MKMFKGLKGFFQTLVFMAVTTMPTWAFAAASPQGKVVNVINGITNLLLIISPSIGALALIWFGIQSYFAADSHKKSELRGNMKGVLLTVAIIVLASTIVKWVAGLAA